MRINASALQAFGEGVATTAVNITKVFEGPVTRLASVYQESTSGTVEHLAIPDSQETSIDISREMVNLMTAERFHEANAKLVQVQDDLLGTTIGLVVNDKV